MNRFMTHCTSIPACSETGFILCLAVGAMGQQRSHGFLMVVNGCNHERGSPIFVPAFRIRAIPEEQFDQSGIPAPGGLQQGCFPIGIAFVHLGTLPQEITNDF